MPKGYWVVRVDVANQEQFQKYAASTGDALEKYDGRFLVHAGQHTVVEGTSRTRNTSVVSGRA